MAQIVGKYEMPENALLGQGQFGKVKAAVHTETGQRVAVKEIKKANIKTKKDVDTVKKEVLINRKLGEGHPNILRMLDMLEDSEKLYLVLELAHGGDLFDKIIDHGGFSEETARIFFRQIISGLEYAHGQGIVHRDMKPENLLLGDQDVLKISDFGLSNIILTPEQMLQTHCGSEKYAAPEVMQTTAPYVGPPVDIWSCGVILYIMVGGAFPFVQANHECELFTSLGQGRFVFPADFSEELKDLLLRMFAISPQDRITIPEIKRHFWFDPSAATKEEPKEPVGATMGMEIEEGGEPYTMPMDEEPVYRTLDADMMSAEAPGFEEEPVYRSIDVAQLGTAPACSEAPKAGKAGLGFACKASCQLTSAKPIAQVFKGVVDALQKGGATVSAMEELGSIWGEVQGASGAPVKVAIKVEADGEGLTHVHVKRLQGHGLDYCQIHKAFLPLLQAECASA